MVDLTDEQPPDSSYIDGYGPDGFRIGGRLYGGPVLVTSGLVAEWPVGALGEATADSVAPLFEPDRGIELVIVGCGPQLLPPPQALSAALRARGVGLEPMVSGAACRTYNLLLIEGRRVAAALIPVGGGGGGG